MPAERVDPLPPRGIMDNAFREAMDYHYSAIAKLLIDRRILRNHWRIEVEGCVVKFDAKWYAKKGTPIWEEQQAELKSVEDEL